MELTDNDRRLNQLFDELVPLQGKAESLAGEIVRATCRIGYRYLNDGDRIGIGYGKETCNPAARFLLQNTDSHIVNILEGMWKPVTDSDYQASLDDLTAAVVQYIDDHPELRKQETEDMFKFTDPEEDRDVDEDDDYDL